MTSSKRTALIAGAGGFIGGHLAKELTRRGFEVRCMDVKPFSEWYQVHQGVDNRVLDLSLLSNCHEAVKGCTDVFNLACNMGGIGFIEQNKALCMLSVLINTHLLMASRDADVKQYFFTSSACVYNAEKQKQADVIALKESDAYPAMPEDGYGWEKLFSERMCRHFREDFGLRTRVVRLHNVYGPHGTWDGGREKAPAAISRKVIDAFLRGKTSIPIWGDGTQTRSFMYVSDCIEGILKIHDGHYEDPINLGSSELVSINGLVDMVQEFAGITLERKYQLDAPKGVRGRNSDNTVIQREFGWEPTTALRDGMRETYEWIRTQMLAAQESLVGKSCPDTSSSISTTGQTSQAQANI